MSLTFSWCCIVIQLICVWILGITSARFVLWCYGVPCSVMLKAEPLHHDKMEESEWNLSGLQPPDTNSGSKCFVWDMWSYLWEFHLLCHLFGLWSSCVTLDHTLQQFNSILFYQQCAVFLSWRFKLKSVSLQAAFSSNLASKFLIQHCTSFLKSY